MNVPSKPLASSQTIPEGPMYLWPGLDPYGQDCGLFQPVLGYADGNGEWWISNWFSHCPGVTGGYCTDKAQTVYPGDTITWWMRHVSGMEYEMGWASSRGSTSKIQYPCFARMPTSAWLIEVESYFQLAGHPEYEKYMPTSQYHVWDVIVRDKNNQDVSQSGKSCQSTHEKHLDCDWAGHSFVETFQTSPSPSPSCADVGGYASKCAQWKGLGYCSPTSGSHYAYSQYYCKRTCNFCDVASPPPIWECNGNEACESVQGRVPGRMARALAFGMHDSKNFEDSVNVTFPDVTFEQRSPVVV